MVIEEKKLVEGKEIKKILNKLLSDILAKHKIDSKIALVGIKTGGVYIADWLCKTISEKKKKNVSKGMIDITLYRDDIFTKKKQPEVRSTDVPFDINDKTVILIDDVLFTGRTTRAALDALSDLGRPKKVELAVLIDRGHRELPISADYVGQVIETKREQMVEVDFEGKEDNWSVKLKYGIK